MALYHNKDWLEARYFTDGWSQTTIAAYCDVGQATISNWFIRHDLKSKAVSAGKYGENNRSWVNSPYKDRVRLYELYTVQQKSIPDIAKESGHSNATISRWLSMYDIEVRTGTDAIVKDRSGTNTANWSVVDHTLCLGCGRTKSRTSNQCTTCYHDDRRQALYERAESDSALLPISATLRGLLDEWEIAVRDRDHNQCVSCGEQKTTKLNVHHHIPFMVIRDQLIMEHGQLVDYDFSTAVNRQTFIDRCKQDDRLFDVNNGVTLCKQCHAGEHKRIKLEKDDSVYVYYATVVRVKDGDTLSVIFDLGFGISHEADIRLFGVNTCEMTSKDIHKHGKAIAAKKAIELLCVPGRTVAIRTYKTGKFGRWLGVLWLDHTNVNDFLIDTSLAEEYIL